MLIRHTVAVLCSGLNACLSFSILASVVGHLAIPSAFCKKKTEVSWLDSLYLCSR